MKFFLSLALGLLALEINGRELGAPLLDRALALPFDPGI
jgi:hypothetical protein